MRIDTWRKDISSDGVQRMIGIINAKLHEIRGVEDETLAKYVAFLVQTGLTGEEIKTNLENFLHDQTGAFVSWLFAHLVSNMHHYTSPEPKIESAEQRNVSFQARRKNYQSQSSLDAKSSGGSLFGSAKYIHQNPNNIYGVENNNAENARKNIFERLGEIPDNIYGGVENNNAEIARKNIFERLGEFAEVNKNHDGNGGVDNNNKEIARKSIFERLGEFQERNNNHDGKVADKNRKVVRFQDMNNNNDEVADKFRKRTRPDSPPFQFGNNKIISDTNIPTSKKRRLEYKQELPATQFVPPATQFVPPATPFVPPCPTPVAPPSQTKSIKQELAATPFAPPRPTPTPVAPPCPTKSIRRPASARKVSGTPRNNISKAKRNSVFDRLGKKIDPQKKGSNGGAANEGTHTSENLEARSVAVLNVHHEATSSALIKHFMSCGKVNSIQMLYNISTGHPTGTAIVDFDSKEAANRALGMNGSTFMYRKLQVAPKSLSLITTGREHIQSSANFQWTRDPSTTDNLANSRNPTPSSNIANSTRPAPISNIANSTIPPPNSNLANSTRPAPISNIANSTRVPLAHTTPNSTRVPLAHTTPNSTRVPLAQATPNSTRVPLAQTTVPRNFQWRRDATTTDNLANPSNPAPTSNIGNSRRQPTFQRIPTQKPKPTWKF